MNPATTSIPPEIIQQFKDAFEQRVNLTIARDMKSTNHGEQFQALAYTVRDEMIDKWLTTQLHYYKKNPKRIYYLSLEFLMGRTLGNALLNLQLTEVAEKAMQEFGFNINILEEVEEDAGLGNGGLGRLAACFLDSLATLELPAYGYGIRYEYGMFRQSFQNGQQKESPDNWLSKGSPWEIARTEKEFEVQFKGKVNQHKDQTGQLKCFWENTEKVIAICHDIPIPGYNTKTVNSLKLWSAQSSHEFSLEHFNDGDYIGSIIHQHESEVISKVLYPNDNNYKGKELRLKQQYFMVTASLQDILERLFKCGNSIFELPDKAVIQLNDTHPSIAIVELMRILIDEHNIPWNEAWGLTVRTFAYTNHTVLPEALERWPVSLIQEVLPRHMEIIFEINQRFLDRVATTFPGDFNRRTRMSIIEEEHGQQVRMSHLAIIGSSYVNGVAELHSELLKTGIFKDFYELYPEKFQNKTNGITPRRWLKKANPALSNLITNAIGDKWIKNLSELHKLEPLAVDPNFQEDWAKIKLANKETLSKIIYQHSEQIVNLNSIFDVQVKRIHEYKRQFLSLLHIVYLYNLHKNNQAEGQTPRTFIFGGKAAPGYMRAKEIIALINQVSHLIHRDHQMQGKLSSIFLPNYGVSMAESIFPGSDLSEQISTAGMEASGTGNMKFALNGALTIGTLDGANVEIQEEVGEDNIFIFGLKAHEVEEIKRQGYQPKKYYEEDQDLRLILNQIRDGYFNPDNPSLFKDLVDYHLEYDPFLVLADFRAYVDCQAQVSTAYQDQQKWTEMSILNVARIGKFSSDRVIKQYSDEIWKTIPCPVP